MVVEAGGAGPAATTSTTGFIVVSVETEGEGLNRFKNFIVCCVSIIVVDLVLSV